MNHKYPEWNAQVALGEQVCIRLKILYHPETPWADCYRKVGHLFTDLKKIARQFYTDKCELDILKELSRLSAEQLKVFFEHGNDTDE